MDVSIEQDQEHRQKSIRKLRKKLRQIEKLEKAHSEMTAEEKTKVSLKHEIRSNLQSLLAAIAETDVSYGCDKSEPDITFGQKQQAEEGTDEMEDDPTPIRPSETSSLLSSHFTSHTGPPDNRSYQLVKDQAPLVATDKAKSGGDSIKLGYRKSANHSLETDVTGSLKGSSHSKKVRTLQNFWGSSNVVVTELHGHNDTVTCVDALENRIVSGSRDTTVKLWDAASGKEMKSMGGHTEQVTAIKILPTEQSDALRSSLDPSTVQGFTDVGEKQNYNEQIVISGSTDCCIRLWLIPRGVFIKSMYNYNPVSALTYHNEKKHVVVGSTNGNLTVYDLRSSVQIYSSTVHTQQITEIQILNDNLFTSSLDGDLKFWKITRNLDSDSQHVKDKLSKLEFDVSSEDFNITLEDSFEKHDSNVREKCIHSFVLLDNCTYHGDDGASVKVWNLSTDEISRFKNHKSNVPGITDGLQLHELMLFSTSYDLDSGRGSINARSLHPSCYGAYIATFSRKEIPRLTSFCAQLAKQPKYFITGGEKLLLWKFYEHHEMSRPDSDEESSFVIKSQNVADLATPPEDCSDYSSEDVEIEDAEDEGRWFWQKSKTKSAMMAEVQETNNSGNNSEQEECSNEATLNVNSTSTWNWCTIL